MNENAIVEELYDAINNHGLMNTICTVFGKGCQIELGYTKKLCDTEVKDLDLSVRSCPSIRSYEADMLLQLFRFFARHIRRITRTLP